MPEELEDRGDEFIPTEEEEQPTQQEGEEQTAQREEPESKEDFLERLEGMSEEEADAELQKLQELGKLEEYFPDEEEEQQQEEEPQSPMIPKARFDEALAKERARTAALEERLNALERGQQQAPPQPQGPTIDEQLRQVRKDKIKAYQDEDWDKVAELEERQEALIEKKVSGKAEELATEKAREAGETVSRQTLQDKLNEVSDQIVGRHPELAEDTDAAKERIESFEAYRDFFITRKGMSPVKAMLAAEKKIFPEQQAQQKSDPDALRKAILKRREDSLRKKIRTNEAQPPRAAGRKHASAALSRDVAKMSDEEFEKLTPTELAKARGDILEVEE